MFRKLVSNLPFSPALVGQLGSYANRLSKEQAARRLGLIFTALALVVQSFAIFIPPEQALATSESTILPNGVSSAKQIVEAYDAGAAGQNDFKGLMDYFGITRNELQSIAQNSSRVCSDDHFIASVSRQHHYSTAEGELSHQVPVNGNFTTFYSVPLYRFDAVTHQTNCYDVFVGSSQKAGWFAVDRASGNLQIKQSQLKLPRAHFTSSSCTNIQGYAYDQRLQDQKIKIYLFFGGAPGKGEQYGPIIASTVDPSSPDGPNHGFKFEIPEKYRSNGTATTVWGVMQPAAGWTGPDVQFDNTIQIPGNCKTEGTPVAVCDSLQTNLIERNKFTFTTAAHTAQGAAMKSYDYTVVDKDGKTVTSKSYPSSSSINTSDYIDLKDSGQYTVKVTLKTNAGDVQGPNCTKELTVSPTDKCVYSAPIGKDDPRCQPCPYDTSLWSQDENCVPHIVLSKEARNLSQGGNNADLTTALPGDRIQFNLRTVNLSQNTTNTVIQENISDILEYASIWQDGGGIVDASTNTISWGDTAIKGSSTDTRTFVMQINDTIADTPRAANEPAAYDCVVTNSYGNTINIFMACPIGKVVENTIKQLPAIGPGFNVVFSTLLLLITTYLYTRSRQLGREVRIIRKDFTPGPM